jgi:hypothetical protein
MNRDRSPYLDQVISTIKEIDKNCVHPQWTEMDSKLDYLRGFSDAELFEIAKRLSLKEKYEVIVHYDLVCDVLYMCLNKKMLPEERYLIEHFIVFCHTV